ncbi:MAG: hypothetical protein FJW35_05710 [Acidobacteria bacterium]|nr:hypothetical protein [Acidobacteriota bacterium]
METKDRMALLDRRRILQESIYRLQHPIPIDQQNPIAQFGHSTRRLSISAAEEKRENEARLQALTEELTIIEADLAALEPLGPENPIRWDGSASDLVELFSELRIKRYIQAGSQNELLAQIVLHFIGADGKTFSRGNLKRCLSSRRSFSSNVFASIPINNRADSDKPKLTERTHSRRPAKIKGSREGKK